MRRSLWVASSLAALYLIWSSTYLAQRLALDAFPPLRMGGLRFSMAGAVLFAVLRGRGARWPTWAEWRGAAILGLLMPAIGNGGVAFAQQWVPTGLTALAVGTVPLWTAMFSGLLGRWPARIEWLGLGLGALGVALLQRDHGLAGHPAGAFALLCATSSWALGSVLSQRLTKPSGLMSTATQMLCAGAFLLLGSWASGEHARAGVTGAGLWAFAYLVLFGSLLAYSAYTYLLQTVRPTIATSYAFVNPALALLLGAMVLHEPISSNAVGAIALILVALALVLFGRDALALGIGARDDTP